MDDRHRAEILRRSEACSAPHRKLRHDADGLPINEPWDGYHGWLEAVRIAEMDSITEQ